MSILQSAGEPVVRKAGEGDSGDVPLSDMRHGVIPGSRNGALPRPRLHRVDGVLKHSGEFQVSRRQLFPSIPMESLARKAPASLLG